MLNAPPPPTRVVGSYNHRGIDEEEEWRPPLLYAPCAQVVHLFLISANTRRVLQGAHRTWGPCLGPPLLSLAQTLDSGDS